MPNKITGYMATEPRTPVKGSGGSGQVIDKSQITGTSAGASAGAGTSAPASTADHVTLTGSARAMQKLADAVAASPAVNAAKVAAVKQSLQNGTYKVNSGQVASKILQFERGLK